MFDHIIGNDQVKTYLTRMVQKQMIGNSLLFAGPDGVGKSLFAKAFAKMLIPDPRVDHESHPDVHHYRPEGKIGMHSIESMRRFSEEVFLSPLESKWKIFIIYDAERMLSYSANALLKTFEEPAQDAMIILVSSAPNRLLPTVFSRCRTVYFQELSEEQRAQLPIKRENSLEPLVLELLAHGTSNYCELSDRITLICKKIEDEQQELEKKVREELKESFQSDLSAVQKQALEKELEGVIAMELAEQASQIFETVLGWYRDIELLRVGGNPSLLLFPTYRETLQRGSAHSLETVNKAIQEAKLATERSTGLAIVLENLFLKL